MEEGGPHVARAVVRKGGLGGRKGLMKVKREERIVTDNSDLTTFERLLYFC